MLFRSGDWKIILQTIFIVIHREGINSETSVTMDEFFGNIESVKNNITSED